MEDRERDTQRDARHVERHRLEAVAGLVGCSLATAKRRIGRAQAFLNEHFVSPFAGDT